MHLLKSTSGEPDFRCLLPAACRLSIATVCCALCAGAADFDVRGYGAKGDGKGNPTRLKSSDCVFEGYGRVERVDRVEKEHVNAEKGKAKL